MEKANIINVIVSIFMMVVGTAFCLFTIITNDWIVGHIGLFIIGIILIVYGVIRIILTNRAAHDI